MRMASWVLRVIGLNLIPVYQHADRNTTEHHDEHGDELKAHIEALLAA